MIAEFTAARGARFMDRRRPGWARQVRRGALVMESGDRCILGQVHGSYERGLRELGIGGLRACWYGFMAIAPYARCWDALDRAWQAEVYARQALALAA